MSELKIALDESPEPGRAHPSDFWFVVAVDKDGYGYVVDSHPDASEMLDGAGCEDNGIDYPQKPGLYKLTNLDFTTGIDWETGVVDEWFWNLGDSETLWEPGA